MAAVASWADAPGLLRAYAGHRSSDDAGDCYRLGDGYLCVQSTDPGFRERMAILYRECRVARRPVDDLPEVTCRIHVLPAAQAGLATFEDAEPLADMADFVLQVFPDRGFREGAAAAAGWRTVTLGAGEGSGSVAVYGQHLMFRPQDPWRPLVGSVAVSRLVRLQRRLVFFHAASVGVSGDGVMLVGPKGAGKTTLSLALMARGHAFLGDELAGVRLASQQLVPVRRSLAVRPGPRAEAVTHALERQAAPTEVFPDGSRRLRAQPGELFPAPVPEVLPLRAIVFLSGFAPRSRIEPFEPGPQDLGQMTPIGASLWGIPAARRAFDMMSLLSRTRCYRLVAGTPDAAASEVEKLMEEQ